MLNYLRAFLVFLLPLFFIAGCKSSEVNDLKLGLLKKVSIEELDAEFNGANFNVLKERYLLNHLSDIYVVKATIESNKNLFDVALKNDTSIYVKIFFCENPNEVTSLGLPFLYSQSGIDLIGFIDGSSLQKDVDVNENKYFYKIFIFSKFLNDIEIPKAMKIDKNQENYKKFDLTSEAQDICFYISGSDMAFKRLKSNTVEISGDSIKNVLK